MNGFDGPWPEHDTVDYLMRALKSARPDDHIFHVTRGQLEAVAALRLEPYLAFRAGFQAGFNASGEGWNAEYPFHKPTAEEEERLAHEEDEALREWRSVR